MSRSDGIRWPTVAPWRKIRVVLSSCANFSSIDLRLMIGGAHPSEHHNTNSAMILVSMELRSLHQGHEAIDKYLVEGFFAGEFGFLRGLWRFCGNPLDDH